MLLERPSGYVPRTSEEVPAGELQTLASSTRRAPSSVNTARNRISRVFVVWQRYGRDHHRDTGGHRHPCLRRPRESGREAAAQSDLRNAAAAATSCSARSEEHTSELQSRQ